MTDIYTYSTCVPDLPGDCPVKELATNLSPFALQSVIYGDADPIKLDKDMPCSS